MLTETSRETLRSVQAGTRVQFQIMDFKTEVPALMAKDSQSLLSGGQSPNAHGTHAAAEVWILNMNWSPETARVLDESPLTYKLLKSGI